MYKYIIALSLILSALGYVKYEIVDSRDNKIKSLENELKSVSSRLNECLIDSDSKSVSSFIEGIDNAKNRTSFTFHT
jgi:hypothetical protein